MSAEYGYGWLLLTVAIALLLIRLFVWKRIQRHVNGRVAYSVMNVWRDYANLTVIMLLAFIVRIPKLFEPLWYDESFTARIASLPLAQLPDAILGDVHPPLPYLIQWATARIYGTSEAALRLPALIAGLFAIYLIYRLARALQASDNAALLAAFLAALSPAMIYYSNEARVYELLACVVFAAMICILERRGRWLWLALGLLPHLHNIGFIYLAVLGAAAVAYDRRLLIPVIIAGAVGALWLPGLLLQSADVADGFWLTPLTVPGVAWTIIRSTVGTTWQPLMLIAYVPAIGITFMAAWHLRRWLKTPAGLVFAALVIGVPLALALASWFWAPVFLIRALLPSGAVLMILWAAFITSNTAAARLAAAVCIPTFVVAWLGSYAVPRAMDYQTILANCEGADTVYYTDVAAAFLGTYYLPRDYVLWDGANDLNQQLTPAAKAAFGFVQGNADQLVGQICIVIQDSPYQNPAVLEHVSSLVAAHEYTELVFHPIEEWLRGYLRIRIILVEL